jgi:hypothetical protein
MSRDPIKPHSMSRDPTNPHSMSRDPIKPHSMTSRDVTVEEKFYSHVLTKDLSVLWLLYEEDESPLCSTPQWRGLLHGKQLLCLLLHLGFSPSFQVLPTQKKIVKMS